MKSLSTKDPFKYMRELQKKKEQLEREMEELIKLKKEGKISEEEFEKRKKKIEREYVEVMDRLVQMRYITGEERLFA